MRYIRVEVLGRFQTIGSYLLCNNNVLVISFGAV